MKELLGSERISAVAVSDEAEVFGKLFQVLEGHAHSHDAGADAAVIRYLMADHCTGCRIDDQPDITLDAADLDVGFISNKGSILFVRIGINKRFDADCRSLAVVGDHLVG